MPNQIRCVRVWAAYCGEDDCHAAIAPGPPTHPDSLPLLADLYAAVLLEEPGWVFGPADDARCPTHAPVAPWTPIPVSTVPHETALALQVR